MAKLDTIIMEFDIENRGHKKIPLDEFAINPKEENKIYWIHFNLNDLETVKKIARKIELSSDVIELFEQNDPIPKLIDFDDTVTIQIPCLLTTEIQKQKEIFGNLIIHLSSRYCITAAKEQIPALIEFQDTYVKSLKFAKTPCFILFLIFDNIVNEFAKILFNFETISDHLDSRIRASHENIYGEVVDIKNDMLRVRRYIVAMREILMRISGRKISVISDRCRASLSNLLNETHMISHEADSIRDILNDLLDQIDNTLMQKMNETMRVLTAFAAIFLPLTLITGIYGMNFRWMPELEWKYGYFAILILLVVCGGVLLFWFKKKKWF